MRVQTKGINSRRKGSLMAPCGPITGPGRADRRCAASRARRSLSPAYNEAAARKVIPPRGNLLSVLHDYQASEDFLGLAPRSRADYVGKIKLIEKAFGDFPLSAMTDSRTRGIFKAWRERLAVSSRRQADYAWVVLARVLSWGMDRGLVAANPCARGGRLYRGSRAEKIWTA